MSIEALGYIGVRTKDLAQWATYGGGFLGMQRIDRSRGTLSFRFTCNWFIAPKKRHAISRRKVSATFSGTGVSASCRSLKR